MIHRAEEFPPRHVLYALIVIVAILAFAALGVGLALMQAWSLVRSIG